MKQSTTKSKSRNGVIVSSKNSKISVPKGKAVKKKTVVETDEAEAINVLSYTKPIKQVKDSDRPDNVLDRKPGEHEAKNLTDIVEDFCEEGVLEELEEFLLDKNEFIVYSYLDYSKDEWVPLHSLKSALAVQRPISKTHLLKIQKKYNRMKLQTPIVIKVKHKGKWHYYIVDGQHTAATQGIRAKLGLIKEVSKENWEDVQVRCSVIVCQDFTFAREVFLGINGDDKLELAFFDKWKNYVLGARQDDADNEFWQDCLELQEILEEHGIVTIHENETEEVRRKPGAFIDVKRIEDKKPDDVRWIARLHQLLWDDKHVDSFEIDPMLLLRDKIKKNASLDNKETLAFVKELGSIIRHTAGSPAGWKKYTQKTYPMWFKATHPLEADKKVTIPDDASLALLLFAYQEAGGKFKELRLTFLTENFTKRGETLFDYLSTDGKEVNEHIKSMIRGIKDSE